jgi:adenosine deaminase
MPALRVLIRWIVCALLVSPMPSAIAQQTAARPTGEPRAARAFDHARQQGPLALYAFFHDMPKGADLHLHLTGAVYAESYIREAAGHNLCVNTQTLTLFQPPATGSGSQSQPPCGAQGEPVAEAFNRQKLYDQLINVFSMRTFVPTTEESGHDHFFTAFRHFDAIQKPELAGVWVDEVASRAASQNEQYLEVMNTPDFSAAAAVLENIGPIDMQTDFVNLRRKLLDAGLAKYLPAIRAEFDQAEHRRRELEHCDTGDSTPGCRVQVRFLYQVLRALPSPMVFLQLLCGFELASADPLIVGVNMVQPEDWRMAVAHYRLQMQMVRALHELYPKVHITLHAGELGPGMVSPEDLRFHIRTAVEVAHAERIGHGASVMLEEKPYDLLKEMATKRVMAEINLTSNDVILNLKGPDHPLPMYRLYHVPVALSTDDEGVSRINLTHEYVRAAMAYPLGYNDFKQMVRTGIEHSFLPGDSLWEQPGPWEAYTHPRAACRAQFGLSQASGACASLLAASEKARQQFELERRFHAFEDAF